MKKTFLSAILLSMAFLVSGASAQFKASQTPAQLQAEVAAQVKSGMSLVDIAKAADVAGVEMCALARAMLGTGATGREVVTAILAANRSATCVIDEALASGAVPAVVRAAAIAAGMPSSQVDMLMAAAAARTSPFVPTPRASGSDGNPGQGGGGGKPSGS